MGLVRDALEGVQALIFDCDGTLVESGPVYAQAWSAGMRAAGAFVDEAWYLERNGLSEHVLLDEFEKAFSLSLDRELLVLTMRSAYLEHLVDLREITAVAAIARAAWRLLPIAVASGGPKLLVDRSLRVTGLRPLFDTIVTFDDVGVAKPQPDIFLRAASDMDIAPQHCLVLEDSPQGIQAAAAAGMRCISVHDTRSLESLLDKLLRLLEWAH